MTATEGQGSGRGPTVVEKQSPPVAPAYEDLIQQTLRQYQNSKALQQLASEKQQQNNHDHQGLLNLNIATGDSSMQQQRASGAAADKRKPAAAGGSGLESLVHNSLLQYQHLASAGRAASADLSLPNGSDITLEQIYQIETSNQGSGSGGRTHPISSDSDSFKSDENKTSSTASTTAAPQAPPTGSAKRPRHVTSSSSEENNTVNNTRRKLLKSMHGARKGPPENNNPVSDSASTFSGVTNATVSDNGSSTSNDALKTDSNGTSLALPGRAGPKAPPPPSLPPHPSSQGATKNSILPGNKQQLPAAAFSSSSSIPSTKTTHTKKAPPKKKPPRAPPSPATVAAAAAAVKIDPNLSEEQKELERKRELSRISSRRSRERERQRLDYWKGEKEQLEQSADNLRKENALLKELIEKIKAEMNLRTIQSALLGNIPGIMFK